MAEWRKLTIGDLCDIISDTYRRNDSEVVLVNTSDVLEGRILNHQCVENKNLKGQFKKTFKKNDILYSEIRPANKRYAYVDFDETENYIASTKLMVLRPKTDMVLPRFLFAILTSDYVLKELQHLAETRSGTFPQITFSSELAPMPIALPDFYTQEKIVGILDLIQWKIQNNSKINDNLLEQAESIFNKYYDASMSQQPFTSIISVLGGGTPKTSNPDFWNGTIPFCTPKDVGDPYTFQTEKYITDNGLKHCNSRLYPINTSFVTARGTVGKVGLAGVPMAINQSCYALASDTIEPILVYFYTLKAVDSLKHKASGAVFDAIVTRDFNTEIIKILSETDSKDVLEIVSPMLEIIHNNVAENMRLSALRDTLLPQLMSGELDVSNINL